MNRTTNVLLPTFLILCGVLAIVYLCKLQYAYEYNKAIEEWSRDREVQMQLDNLERQVDRLRCNPFYEEGDPPLLEDPFCERPIESQPYGVTKWREAYGGMGLGGHPGLDWAAETGTPIRAAHDGIVFEAYGGHNNAVDGKEGYGNRIKIRTRNGADGYETVYAHLDEVLVETGEHVRRGQMIGRVGDTGFSSKPHLHFGIRFLWYCRTGETDEDIGYPCEVLDGNNGLMGWVDPTPYLRAL